VEQQPSGFSDMRDPAGKDPGVAPVSAGNPGPARMLKASAEEVLASLGTTQAGLTSPEAASRLQTHGPNALAEGRPVSVFRVFLGQFKSLIIWVLIGAGVLSGILGETLDSLAILAIVILNAIIGFYQEFKAGKSIAALKKLSAPQAKVWRDGAITSLPAADIVPGDILSLEAGDLVAADARILESSSLRCLESALTGESEPVAKRAVVLDQEDIPLGDRENMVFMGTSVTAGAGLAVVTATAMETELGRIAALIVETESEPKTPLQKRLDAFGTILLWVTLGIVVLLFGLGLLRGVPLFELIMTSVSLAVAVVPEGLPAVVTVALALGVLRMSRRRALVRRLPAVETLGSTTVICTDKTGTLTVGEMTVRVLYVAGQRYDVGGEGYGPGGEILQNGQALEEQQKGTLLELAAIQVGCNKAHLVQEKDVWSLIGDPTEGALLVVAGKLGVHPEDHPPDYSEIPFDSDRKMSSMIRELPDGRLRAYSHGAPGTVLQRCSQLYTSTGIRAMTDEDRKLILEQTSSMAQDALRVLASGRRDMDKVPASDLTADLVERDLVFIGLSGMFDPPRPEVREAVSKCRAAGIRVVMITGDHPETALAIARNMGIANEGEKATSGIELDGMDGGALRQGVSKLSVYARVTAEHKLRIIRAWKENDAVVAMTGDGVNDAPAIQGADIGIAMGRSGTEVTRQAADMIITDDDFSTIVAAVEEGRGIYENIRKTLQYLLAGNAGELLLMTLCVVVGLPMPLLPIHLLWINLVTDGLPALCLATDPIDPDVMSRKPRLRSENMTDRRFLGAMLLTGSLTAGVAFAVYVYTLGKGDPGMARNSAFTVLVFAELLRAFGGRSETRPLWRIPFFSNLNLAIVVSASIALQVWSQYSPLLGRFLKTSPLSFLDTLWLFGLGGIPLLVLEAVKLVRNRKRVSPSI